MKEENLQKLTPLQKAFYFLKQADEKIAKLEKERAEPIAIIGLGCRFPGGGNTPDNFWQILEQGVDTIREIPKERWDVDAYYDSHPGTLGKMYTRYGGFLTENIDFFDAQFFGIAPKEVELMDPQQRLVLEVTWEALENASINPYDLRGTSTGIFIGVCNHDFSDVVSKNLPDEEKEFYLLTGNTISILSGRMAYILGLTGPSVSMDTACSSSLTALHEACQSLRSGECNLALSGGVNILLNPDIHMGFCAANALAPDGHCKTFDARGDGYVRGEGCGMIVLKRLSDALADKNPIIAVIRSSAINQDGPRSGLTVPSKEAQASLIRSALTKAHLEPDSIDLIEAHGTGTPLGDPIEIGALSSVFAGRKDKPFYVGSVKTNCGHLEGAAGVIGVIKMALALQRGMIPAHLNFEKLNPHISLDALQVQIPLKSVPWPKSDHPRRGGVNAFGFSGTNAHAILEEAPPNAKTSTLKRPSHLLTLSTKNEKALVELVQSYKNYLSAHPEVNLGDLVFTANTGRAHFESRLAIVADNVPELLSILQNEDLTISEAPVKRPKIAFLFTGQGSQYPKMGKQLYDAQPLFKTTIDHCASILDKLLDKPLLEILFKEDTNEIREIDRTGYAQPALFAFEYALAELWKSWGIIPDFVMGHSAGEYVAATVAGIISLEDGLKLIAARARLMQALPPGGAMASLAMDVGTVKKAIAECNAQVEIGAINGPMQTVISGEAAGVDKVLDYFKERNIKMRRLYITIASHSKLMEPMLDEFLKVAETIVHHPPKISFVSNLTGQVVSSEVLTPSYWTKHIRQPVQFNKGIAELVSQDTTIFLEIGPHPVLVGLGSECVPEGKGNWLPSLRRDHDEWKTILESVGQLYRLGAKIDWKAFEAPYENKHILLPNYPFQRERYWPKALSQTKIAKRPSEDVFKQWCYQMVWKKAQDVHPDLNKLKGNWLIVSDGKELSRHLIEKLQEMGSLCTVLKDENNDLTLLQKGSFKGILCVGISVKNALTLSQALVKLNQAPSLCFVTWGVHPLTDTPVNLSQAPLVGFFRSFALEYPDLDALHVDLDAQNDARVNVELLLAELATQGKDNQVAYRKSTRFVPRIVHLPVPEKKTVTIDAQGSYLITGGLGALGLKTAEWLVLKGARHLVLTGRKGASESNREWLRSLEIQGVKVETVRCDISQENEVASLMQKFGTQWPTLKGIIHSAGILHDALLSQQEWSYFEEVFAPKVSGASLLHQYSLKQPLDFCVFYSSAASLGNPGQTNYSAANAYLDALAHYRRQQGLPALSIGWGPWGEIGLAMHSAKQLEKVGWNPLPTHLGIKTLEYLLEQNAEHVLVADVDWKTYQQSQAQESILFSELVPQQEVKEHETLLQKLEMSVSGERELLLRAHLQNVVRKILGLPTSQMIKNDQGFFESGMDSLMAVQLKNKLQHDVGPNFKLASSLAFDHPTINSLARFLKDLMFPEQQENISPTVSAVTIEEEVNSMDLDDIKKLIEEYSE